MTMQIKVTNEDTNPHRAAKVTTVSRAAEFPTKEVAGVPPKILRHGESATFWVHRSQDLRVEEVDVEVAP